MGIYPGKQHRYSPPRMGRYLDIHPTHPQPRLVQQAVVALHAGGILAYPSDSGYALGCHIGDKIALERIRQFRQLDKRHYFTLMCRDLREIATYAKVSNSNYRLLKANTPGQYTFVLPATREVPRRLQHPKRKTIGLRIPDHPVAQALLAELEQPMMSCSLILPNAEQPLTELGDYYDLLIARLDLVLDAGVCDSQPTTVLNLVAEPPELIREGAGDITWLG